MGLKKVRARPIRKIEDVDGREVPGEDQPQNEDRPSEVARHQDETAVETVGENAGERAGQGGQQAGDERAPHGRGAARDLDHQHDERDHGDRVAQERGALADPQSQEASVL